MSDLCQELDADIQAWQARSLEQAYPYLIIAATYLYIRSGGQVVSEGVLIVTGISESGHREILSLDVAHTETEATWTSCLKTLKKRGLMGVQLVISDHHKAYKGCAEMVLFSMPSNDTFSGLLQHCQNTLS